MTPEAMRITIAESEGWKRGKRAESSFSNPSQKIYNGCWFNPRGIAYRKLPDFCEDLNAILPLLPLCVIIHEANRWCIRSNFGVMETCNQSLALAACEFYLKWKGLWS